jgi:hypothetical protein
MPRKRLGRGYLLKEVAGMTTKCAGSKAEIHKKFAPYLGSHPLGKMNRERNKKHVIISVENIQIVNL